jgi:hypothetical protein
MKDIIKPETLEMSYNGITQVSIDDIEEELKIKWKDVKDVGVKWSTIYITLKNGTELQYGCDYDIELQAKRPYSVMLYGEDKTGGMSGYEYNY